MSRFFKRRDILAIAPGLLGAVFARPRKGHAAGGSVRRLLIMYTPNGAHDGRWVPQGVGADFKLPPMLASLEPLRHRTVLCSGLRQAQHNDSPGAGDQHDQGVYQMLTGCKGVRQDNAAWAGGISVDQFVAPALQGPSRRKSLELGVYGEKDGPLRKATDRNVISYQGAAAPLVPLIDPCASVSVLFEGITGNSGTMVGTDLRRGRKRLLDHLRLDVAALSRQARGADRQRLDEVTTALSEVEKVLVPTTDGKTCAAPTLADRPAGRWTDATFPLMADAQIKIALAALRCEVSSVVTLMFAMAGGGSGDPTFDFAPVNVKERHHELSHKADAVSKEQFDRIHDYYTQRFVQLCRGLQDAQDASGRSLLDDTLVWWTSDLGNAASHDGDNIQQILAGGGLMGGRHLVFDRQPHNKLLTSICHAAGVATAGFGDQKVSLGGLPGLW